MSELATFLTAHLVPREYGVLYRVEGEAEDRGAEPLTLDEAKAWLVALGAYEDVVRAEIVTLCNGHRTRSDTPPMTDGLWSE